MNTVTVTLASSFNNNKTTTVRAKVRATKTGGHMIAEISRNQLRRAAARCCYAGTDSPRVIGSPDGFRLDAWEPTQDGGLSAIKLAA